MFRGLIRIAALLAGALFSGCLPAPRSVVLDVPPQRWQRPVTLHLANDDTTGRYDLDVIVRYNGELKAGALPLEIAVRRPDSLHTTERLTLRIRPRSGAAALLRDTTIPYRRQVVLDRAGDYTFTLRPVQPVRGVEAVGLRLTPKP